MALGNVPWVQLAHGYLPQEESELPRGASAPPSEEEEPNVVSPLKEVKRKRFATVRNESYPQGVSMCVGPDFR